MALVSLGVGSNIEKEQNMRSGILALRAVLTQVECSPVYESTAVGFDGENFLNCVVVGETELSLAQLHQALKTIEFNHGRISADRYSAKTLDIDILTFENLVGEFDSVVLPRDEIVSSAFVLKPLSDVWPEKIHPVAGESYITLWRNFNNLEGRSLEYHDREGSHQEQKLWPVDLVV